MILAALLLATIEVGPERPVSSLSDAANMVSDGDTVLVDSGIYTKGAIWRGHRLIIRAAPRSAKDTVIVREGTVEDKALFVVKGDDVTIWGLRFESAVVPDGNGAGIRAEGRNLSVGNSSFERNEMGILAAGPHDRNRLVISNSRFSDTFSRKPGAIGHHLYVGTSIEGLLVHDSHFMRANSGHAIKSRARNSVIVDNDIDDTQGSASYLIDLPEGGSATIRGNRLVKGREASECCVAIAYGFEMRQGKEFQNPPGAAIVTDNIFVNETSRPASLLVNRSTPRAKANVYNNHIAAATAERPQAWLSLVGFGVAVLGLLAWLIRQSLIRPR